MLLEVQVYRASPSKEPAAIAADAPQQQLHMHMVTAMAMVFGWL